MEKFIKKGLWSNAGIELLFFDISGDLYGCRLESWLAPYSFVLRLSI